ncbi:hypothetical protein FRC11_010682 [Ceratobasidium sp. 423]|nr:hypothetical protein FRC11_010682 [Ceratobasidium sp. 423]
MQMNRLLEKFSSSLSSLALYDVTVDRRDNTSNRLPDFPSLTHLALQSTRGSTFQTLELLETHGFERLSIAVAPTVELNLLLGALSKGAFPRLKQIEIHFNPKGHWSSSARWDSTIRDAVQAACDKRHITLTMVEGKYQKESWAKVRVRRRVHVQP